MNDDAPLRTPVLIVGGGPVGLATAMELAHQGIRCAVVEPRTEVVATRPRAKTTSARTMELFRRWGFADALRARAPITVGCSSDIVDRPEQGVQTRRSSPRKSTTSTSTSPGPAPTPMAS